MSRHAREDTCPTCRVVFKGGQKCGGPRSTIGKTCPNGHFNPLSAIAALRPGKQAAGDAEYLSWSLGVRACDSKQEKDHG